MDCFESQFSLTRCLFWFNGSWISGNPSLITKDILRNHLVHSNFDPQGGSFSAMVSIFLIKWQFVHKGFYTVLSPNRVTFTKGGIIGSSVILQNGSLLKSGYPPRVCSQRVFSLYSGCLSVVRASSPQWLLSVVRGITSPLVNDLAVRFFLHTGCFLS